MFGLPSLAAQHGRRVLAVLVLGLAPQVASAAERYVVVESPPFAVRAVEEDRLSSAIQTGLRAAGCDVVGGAVRQQSCATLACWKKVAESNKATDILVVTGGYQGLGWQMSFEHRKGASGAKVGSEKETCDACPFDAMVEKAQATAKHIAQTERESDVPVIDQADPMPQPPSPLAGPSPSTASEANPLITPSDARASDGHPLWPTFLMAGGGALLAGGIVLMAINGRDTDCSHDACVRRYKTMTPGLILGGAGLVAAGVGIWQYLAWQPPDRSVSLRVGLGNLTYAGGF